MRLIDSHCHVHDPEFFGDERQEVYQRAIEAGIGMLTVGTSEASSREAVRFAENRQNIWVAVGVHPHDAKFGCDDIKKLLKEDTSGKIVAIGEIGLDYFYDNSPRDIQQKVFEEQLQLAVDYDLPVSFHVRNAFDDFWPIFNNFPGVKGVLHSFTDNKINAYKGIENGLLVGINGISTFTKDPQQIELYRNLPLEKIILETDAPFLTPKPFRGKMNEVGYVELVAKWTASERQMTLEEVSSVTCKNTRDLFKI